MTGVLLGTCQPVSLREQQILSTAADHAHTPASLPRKFQKLPTPQQHQAGGENRSDKATEGSVSFGSE